MGCSKLRSQDLSFHFDQLIPPWDIEIPISGTSNVIPIQGGPFDRQCVVGLSLPHDTPE
ncbi:hypothetical protein MKW92_027102, partial [Papaver armeniacum]